MKRQSFRVLAIFLATFLMASMIVACKKDGSEAKQSPSETKQATAAKTTAKASASASASATSKSSTSSDSSSKETPSNTGSTGIISEEVKEENSGAVSFEDETNLLEGMDITLEEVFDHEEIDLGGRTITLAHWDQTGLPSPEKNTIIYNRMKAAEKKYNFKMEYKYAVSFDAYKADITSTTLAGVMYSDVITAQALFLFPSYVVNNIVLPWNDYIDFESPIIKANPYMYYGTRWEGKNYGCSQGIYQAAYPDLLFNATLLEREGQPDILDLVEAKQWNWEAFLQIANNCTKDIDGDGLIDQWGVMGRDANNFVTAVLASNGVKIIDDFGNGYEFALGSGAAHRALQFASDLAFVHKVYTRDSSYNVYRQGKAAMVWGNNIVYKNAGFLADDGMNSKVAPHPMGPDVNVYSNIATTNMYSILTTSQMPRESAIIMNEICLLWDENLNPIPQVQEANALLPNPWEASGRRYSTEREYRLCYEGLYPLFQPNFSAGFPNAESIISSKLATPLLNGTIGVAQAVETVRPEIDAIVNQYK